MDAKTIRKMIDEIKLRPKAQVNMLYREFLERMENDLNKGIFPSDYQYRMIIQIYNREKF